MPSAEFSATIRPEVIHPVERSQLNVVIVSESSLEHTSGVTTSVKKVTEYLTTEGHEVTIICPSPAPGSYNGAEVIATKSTNLKGFDVGRKSTKEFRKLYDSLDPDVAHIASPMKTPKGTGLFLGGHAIKAAYELAIPIAAVYQTDAVRFAGHLGLGLAAPIVERQVRLMHNKADITLVPSSASEDDLTRWGVEVDRIARWTRGVDTELFTPVRRQTEAVNYLRRQWTPNGETIVGVVSRLEPEKSIHKLAVLRDLENVKLVVIGDGTQREHLEKVLGDSVYFTGKLSGENLANAYAALDVFAFPSTTDTFAQVIQEAKASGTPVVVANRGGPRDLVEPGVNGFLYEPDTKYGKDEVLRAYVHSLIVSPELRIRMGKAGRRSVEDRTWEAHGKEIVEYYRKAIKLSRARITTQAADQLTLAA